MNIAGKRENSKQQGGKTANSKQQAANRWAAFGGLCCPAVITAQQGDAAANTENWLKPAERPRASQVTIKRL